MRAAEGARPEVGEVRASAGWQEEILEQLEESKGPDQQVASTYRQYQKGFRTQDLRQHQQKPRGCRS